jgi:hypothetical protein
MKWRAAAGLLLALLAFEFLIRQLAFGYEAIDPKLGWMWQDMTVVQRLNEGFGVSHWSHDGTRARPAAQSGPRVLILGDSFTEALQVNDDEAFSGRLRGVEALNAGQSSRSAADYVAFAAELRARFQPAWTVIEVGPFDFAGDAFDTSKTHFTKQLDVVIVPPRFGEISRIIMTVRHHSALLDYGFARWHAYRAAAQMPPLFRAADAESQAPAQPTVEPQWPVEDEMRRIVHAYDGRLTFLFVPQFDAAPGAVESQWRSTCSAAHLSCVDLRDAFDDFRRRGDAPTGFPNSRFGEGHLNARGHAAAAALLQRELERQRALGLF